MSSPSLPSEAPQSCVTSINISPGGIPKLPMESVAVNMNGLVGDGHAHEKHVKPSRAISLLDEEVIEALKKEGYRVESGLMGENLTVRHLDVNRLQTGTRLLFEGGVAMELTDPRKPCFVMDAIHPQLQHVVAGRFGFMAKVVVPGTLHVGAKITVENPEDQKFLI